jgi:hypothetical protein
VYALLGDWKEETMSGSLCCHSRLLTVSSGHPLGSSPSAPLRQESAHRTLWTCFSSFLAANGPIALQIIRASQPQSTRSSVADASSVSSSILLVPAGIGPSQKSTTSRAGYRLDASRNLWDGSGLKVDSALTDVGWGVGGSSFGATILRLSRRLPYK